MLDEQLYMGEQPDERASGRADERTIRRTHDEQLCEQLYWRTGAIEAYQISELCGPTG